jgi:hypothetical protein
MTVGAKLLARGAFVVLVSCGGGSPAPAKTSPAEAKAPGAHAGGRPAASAEPSSRPADERCRIDDIGGTNEAKLDHLKDLQSVCGPREICEIACLRATCDVGRSCAYACGDVAGSARRKGESYEEAFDRAARGFLSGDPHYCRKNRSVGATVLGSGFLEKAYEANPRHSTGWGGSCRFFDGPTPITEIALERSACYGDCPIYSVELHADGTVDYIGVAHVERSGRHRGTIPESWFRSLAELALDIGYFELESSYSCQVTDSPTVYSSATRNGRRKIIRHYAPGMTGPARLRAFEEAVDHFVDYVTWDEKKR